MWILILLKKFYILYFCKKVLKLIFFYSPQYNDLRENEKFRETGFACSYRAQVEFFFYKKCRKPRYTVPVLENTRTRCRRCRRLWGHGVAVVIIDYSVIPIFPNLSLGSEVQTVRLTCRQRAGSREQLTN